MAEHMRANGYQWCDTDRYMVIDSFTGPDRIGSAFVVNLKEALDYVRARQGWEDRKTIVRLDAIVAFPLSSTGSK